jgi:hypothetical protein
MLTLVTAPLPVLNEPAHFSILPVPRGGKLKDLFVVRF